MQANGPFWCFVCKSVLDWRQVKAGRCQGHLLEEYARQVPASVVDAVLDIAKRHMADRKYGRWIGGLSHGAH